MLRLNRGVVYALGAAALFGASTPFAKLLLGEASQLVHSHPHYPDLHHRHGH